MAESIKFNNDKYIDSNAIVHNRILLSNIINELIEVVLYDNTSGTQSTITLSDSVANYKYIEINFRNNDNTHFSTGRLYNINGKVSYLISIGVNSSGKSWLKSSEITISGNKITWSSCFSEITLNNGSSVGVNHANVNYITRVVGYR